jgi:phosphopantothenoylcysteine decarboxylase
MLLDDGITERYLQNSHPEVWKQMQSMEVLTDEDEWNPKFTVGKDPVLHIELRKWADLLLIAPLSANTLAKIANGMCDNLLTSIVRCWYPLKPILLCPAMNTYMWENPFTDKHLQLISTFPYMKVITPMSKTLACGDTGIGAMALVEDIVSAVQAYCSTQHDQSKKLRVEGS